MAGIYKLTAPNGKCYIGQSIELKERLWVYKGNHCKTQRHLHNAIKKYGWENFKVDILWSTKHPERYRNFNVLLDTLEIAWIRKFDSVAKGYNLQLGGHRGRNSEETKRLMSEAQKGVKKKLAHVRKLSTRVVQYDLKGKKIKEWHGIAEAARAMGVTAPGISSVCRGIQNSSGGYQWGYETDGLDEVSPVRKRLRRRSVIQIMEQGDKKWACAEEVNRVLGIDSSSIHKVCRGKRITAGGFEWKYA